MSYSDIVSTIAMIVAFVAIPASSYLSYKSAVIGEKRKEWNAIAEKLLEHYERVLKEASKNQTYSTTVIPLEELEKIQRRMIKKDRDELTALVAQIILLRNSPPTEQRNSELKICAEKACELLKLK
ncbi:hypothetical protein [Atlantibacter hermannii]|uniref:hypothetical protein n=1 Tax=Atlantibacter hermannii TaxID=565 RepID=UPI0013EF0211|nr:hypothetical protein [Atlantibacter hermannii]